MRTRNPWVRLRRVTDGWYVRFMVNPQIKVPPENAYKTEPSCFVFIKKIQKPGFWQQKIYKSLLFQQDLLD